jgi:RHS repeat-associated protein
LAGRRTNLTTPNLSTLEPLTYGYDPEIGTLATISGSASGTYTFFTGRAGLLDSLRMADGSVERYTYDDDGRLTHRVDWSPVLSTIHDMVSGLDGRGSLLSVSMTGMIGYPTESYGYNGLGGAISVSGRTIESTPRDALGNSILRNRATDSYAETYGYEPNSTRLRFVTQIQNDGVTIDSLVQTHNVAGDLTRLNERIIGAELCSDGQGGWSPCEDQSLKRVVAYANTTNSYDSDGRLVLARKETSNDESAFWQPPGVRDPNSYDVYPKFERGVLEEYRYDALGRRVWVRAHRNEYCPGPRDRDSTYDCVSFVERTIYDGDHVLAEIREPGDDSASAAALESDGPSAWLPFAHFGLVGYINGPSIDHPIAIARDYTGLSLTRLSLHYGWQGAVDIGTDASGHLIQCGLPGSPGAGNCQDIEWPGLKVTYGLVITHPFLGPASWWGSVAGMKENATGTLDMRNRSYDPRTGRFTQEDPIGLAGGLNVYGFAGGDPVNYSDPFGLCPPKDNNPCSLLQRMVQWLAPDNRRLNDLANKVTEVSDRVDKVMNAVGLGDGECHNGVCEAGVGGAFGPGSGSGAVAGRITGFTEHGLDQAISRDGVGVANRAILDAVRNPQKVIKQAEAKVKYIGETATVILNRAGEVFTTWARSSAGWRIQP